MRAKLVEQGINPIGSSRQDFAKFMDTEEAKYDETIKASNIKPQ